MKAFGKRWFPTAALAALLGGFGWAIVDRLQERNVSDASSRGSHRVIPVEIAPIEHGSIERRRAFSGTLEALARFVVAPKIGGRIETLAVDVADTVRRGQLVATLDNDEYRQTVVQAEAELTVAEAKLAAAISGLEIAARELGRVMTLRKRGIASESNLDTVRAEHLAKQAAVQVAEAQVKRGEAALASAEIRLGYTRITAGWTDDDMQRVVAERYVDEGDTVAANTPLLSIVVLHPINAIIFVTEKDYARITPGQAVTLITDAYPGEAFAGQVTRVAPVFRQTSRQARVELTVANADRRLKPGMFIRATVVLDRVANATIVPDQALTVRDGATGVFLVAEDGRSVHWHEVKVGIREGERVQIESADLSGQVVTLGQQLLDDGSEITLPVEEAKGIVSRAQVSSQ
jgi:RND family efflux transporter MFP subunit